MIFIHRASEGSEGKEENEVLFACYNLANLSKKNNRAHKFYVLGWRKRIYLFFFFAFFFAMKMVMIFKRVASNSRPTICVLIYFFILKNFVKCE
ncbi:MAG: hypothetical protein COX35_02380 [Candidatus Nealsonbacteria bacterium CG23_combo_of_CG06-09_8_20_14_all_37_18]|uniref:Uncharacterized protein n=1 Tax=Candidatus Nealsonbacteria bacterium CG23_combo_of_CG06-09_8_20_14_all_37_18 TaxID=1974720 RepID=A0A2G9YY23_9BACT|nr:MAG: hypothetical protein COX35_02380 [Candidatus Nealsonbacteria bacterium CG23_combo_of_CG06-09_8_20_14_all_37_18]